jgi:hypothetical protein
MALPPAIIGASTHAAWAALESVSGDVREPSTAGDALTE